MSRSARTQNKFDFLTTPFTTTDGVKRVDDGFEATQPWGRARFDAVQLRRGWWRLECLGDVAALDLRLTSVSEPLIVIPGSDATGRVVYLAVDSVHDISLLVSPWPGRYPINKLRLVRLNTGEQIRMLANVTLSVFERGNVFKRLASAASRVLSGRPVGMRVRTSKANTANKPSANDNNQKPPQTLRIERRGEVIAIIYSDDQLHEAAFDIVATEFARHPHVEAVLADAIEGGVIRPRPAWDRDLFRWADCATPPVFLRSASYAANLPIKEVVAAIVSRYGGHAVARIELPLVSRAHQLASSVNAVSAPQLNRYPRVSVLIPTKTRVDLLTQCLDGLAQRTDYPDFEVVVIDNGHTDPAFNALMARASKSLRIVTIRDEIAFNFSHLINIGAARSSGEVLLSFNDDVDPIDSSWLCRMVASVVEPDVGAVGARLLYPDRTLQHAGIVIGIGGSCGHLWKGLGPHEAAQFPQATVPCERQSVTGACLAVTRANFDRVGGFDAKAFPIGFSDVDFCLRLREVGLRNIYRGDAVLLHKESQSRQSEVISAERWRTEAHDNARFRGRWRDVLQAVDPFGSHAYDVETESGRVHRALAWALED